MYIDFYSETAVYYVANILFTEIVVQLPRYFRWSDKREFDRIEGRFKKRGKSFIRKLNYKLIIIIC